MSLKARYDPKEDRMLLVLKPGEKEQRFWVNRRQWLALYREVSAHAPKSDDASPPPPPRLKPLAPEEIGDAVLLEGIRFKGSPDMFELLFVSSRGNVGIKLKPDGLGRLNRMLELQADRAGWDPAAGLKRLKAGAAAGAAVKRAKG